MSMNEIWPWLMENPARLMVLISIAVTWCIAVAEWNGRKTGGSGWLTLARIGCGAIFSVLTAIVAGLFGGVGAFFGYLLLQGIICVALPVILIDHAMPKPKRFS